MTAVREADVAISRSVDDAKPRRLLWLLDSLDVGGAESLVIPFSRQLDRRRFELFVGSLSTAGENMIERELRADGIATVNFGARSLRDVAAFRRLLRFIQDQRIELVHAHLTYSSTWAALVSRIAGVPSIASLHVAPAATRALHGNLRHRILSAARDALMRFVLTRWSAAVVTVSDALRRTYLTQGGLEPLKVRVVHNGIEVDRFRRDRVETHARILRELDLPPDAHLVVTVAVLRGGKGIEVLLEAAARVPNAYFVIIGDGPKREEWMALANERGIGDRVRWAGFRRDVDALLAGFDLFVHPSLDDAFPTVLLEAMAAGLPVVASDVGGIPEIVTPEVTGRLVAPGDAAALTAAIAALLADRTTLARMREAAREIAERDFSTDAWLERLTTLYDGILAERRP